MTDPARAAVEAWMGEQCPHDPLTVEKHYCPDCLLAFAAAQRVEEREACAQIAVGAAWIGTDMRNADGQMVIATANEIFAAIRARREGPG